MSGNLNMGTTNKQNIDIFFNDYNGTTLRHQLFLGHANSNGGFYLYDRTLNKSIINQPLSGNAFFDGINVKKLTLGANITFTNCTMDSNQLSIITRSGKITHIHAVFTPTKEIASGTALYYVPTDYLSRVNGKYYTWVDGAFPMDGTKTPRRISLGTQNGNLYSDEVLYAGVKYVLDVTFYNAIDFSLA